MSSSLNGYVLLAIHMDQRKHVLAFTLSGLFNYQEELTYGWELAGG